MERNVGNEKDFENEEFYKEINTFRNNLEKRRNEEIKLGTYDTYRENDVWNNFVDSYNQEDVYEFKVVKARKNGEYILLSKCTRHFKDVYIDGIEFDIIADLLSDQEKRFRRDVLTFFIKELKRIKELEEKRPIF